MFKVVQLPLLLLLLQPHQCKILPPEPPEDSLPHHELASPPFPSSPTSSLRQEKAKAAQSRLPSSWPDSERSPPPASIPTPSTPDANEASSRADKAFPTQNPPPDLEIQAPSPLPDKTPNTESRSKALVFPKDRRRTAGIMADRRRRLQTETEAHIQSWRNSSEGAVIRVSAAITALLIWVVICVCLYKNPIDLNSTDRILWRIVGPEVKDWWTDVGEKDKENVILRQQTLVMMRSPSNDDEAHRSRMVWSNFREKKAKKESAKEKLLPQEKPHDEVRIHRKKGKKVLNSLWRKPSQDSTGFEDDYSYPAKGGGPAVERHGDQGNRRSLPQIEAADSEEESLPEPEDEDENPQTVAKLATPINNLTSPTPWLQIESLMEAEAKSVMSASSKPKGKGHRRMVSGMAGGAPRDRTVSEGGESVKLLSEDDLDEEVRRIQNLQISPDLNGSPSLEPLSENENVQSSPEPLGTADSPYLI